MLVGGCFIHSASVHAIAVGARERRIETTLAHLLIQLLFSLLCHCEEAVVVVVVTKRR